MFANKLKLTAAAAALALVGFAGSAEAAPISGGFAIGAGLTGSITTGVDFQNNASGAVVVNSSGSYAGLLSIGMTGSVQDIPSFSGFTPLPGFLDFGGGVTVDLNSIIVTTGSGPGGPHTTGDGLGTCNIPGADPTTCTIKWTDQAAPGGGSPTISISVGAEGGTAVPEPATAALLGSALLGLGLVRRRKQQN